MRGVLSRNLLEYPASMGPAYLLSLVMFVGDVVGSDQLSLS